MPLKALPDLAAFHSLVVEVARELFLRAALKRVRTPRGFHERLELRLNTVREGSAVARSGPDRRRRQLSRDRSLTRGP